MRLFSRLSYSHSFTMAAMNGNSRILTTLSKWSCDDKQLPDLDKIKAIHIYDFDNTREQPGTR